MSSKASGGEDAGSLPTRRGGSDRYIPPARRRQMLAEQERVTKLKQKQLREIKTGDEGYASSSTRVDLSLKPSVVSPKVGSEDTNLGRFLESVTPYVSVRSLLEGNANEGRKVESDLHSYFCLSDLWEYFQEQSAYGAAVPLLLNGKDPVEQYYVPYLSGIQLYRPSSTSTPKEEHDESRASHSTSGPGCSENDRTTESCSSHSSMHQMDNLAFRPDTHPSQKTSVFFQFLECEPPHSRKPLTEKVSELASLNPELNNCKSCDLLPSSWICVAWYPIYRIPVGPTMKDLDACFLTFHALSTQSKCKFPPKFHAPRQTRLNCGDMNPSPTISLPVFGLASYKMRGSPLSNSAPQEHELENSLLQTANDWLQDLQVDLSDYRFFLNRHTHGR